MQFSPSRYIFFRPTLSVDEYTWTGLFIHRLPAFPTIGLFRWRVRENGDLVLVLESHRTDMLEIGLKDEGGGEQKIVLQVQPGWAGYRIRLQDFKGVHIAGLDQIIVAYSHTVGSAGKNTFKIAVLAIR